MKIYTVHVDGVGTKFWYLNDKLHCEHGPAVEYDDGTKFFYVNNELHCEHGPAIEESNGTKHWFLNGERYSEVDWRIQINKLKARKTPCEDKVVEVDGVKYKLVKI